MQLGPAQPSEYLPALEYLFQHLSPSDSLSRIAAALSLLDSSSESHAQMFVARNARGIVGATFVQALPGATGILWPPRGDSAKIEDTLLRESMAWLSGHGTKLAQSVLGRHDDFLGEALVRNGFLRPTQLHYLRCDLDARSATPVRGDFAPYHDIDAAEFHAVLQGTFEETLDFPEMTGQRSVAEVVRGYQGSGYDPGQWWLVRGGNRDPVGVLILSELERGAVWDLAYVGVVPAARRRGWGRLLARKALAEAAAAGARTLTVCVDARNNPARRLYHELGFVEFDRRDVFLRLDLTS